MTEASPASRRWRRRGIAAGAVALVVVAAATWFLGGDGESATASYRFATVSRGPIRSLVSASGSVRPVVNVIVGSQASGQILELKADFNSLVKAGDVIARLDPAAFEAKVWQSEADLKVAQANVGIQSAALASAGAEIEAARSVLKDSEQDLARKKELLAKRVVAESVVDKAIAVRDQAAARLRAVQANQRMQQAQLEHSQAAVEARKAELKQRQLDLDHTIIRSPVDGVVVSRNVDVGQTVAASLQAPTLFTIAQDLRRMQVEVSVDEADIGRLKEDQAVTFTVDSFPGREFAGQVTQIRKAPTEISNVVTYTVVVGADNPDLVLLPGMTANVAIVVGARENILRVENAALRFRPTGKAAAKFDPATAEAAGEKRLDGIMKRLDRALDLNEQQSRDIRAVFAQVGKQARAMRADGVPPEEVRKAVDRLRQDARQRAMLLMTEAQRATYRDIIRRREENPVERGRVWIVDDGGELQPVSIATGISDGNVTEIVRGNIKEGQRVVISQSTTGTASPSRRGLGF